MCVVLRKMKAFGVRNTNRKWMTRELSSSTFTYGRPTQQSIDFVYLAILLKTVSISVKIGDNQIKSYYVYLNLTLTLESG